MLETRQNSKRKLSSCTPNDSSVLNSNSNKKRNSRQKLETSPNNIIEYTESISSDSSSSPPPTSTSSSKYSSSSNYSSPQSSITLECQNDFNPFIKSDLPHSLLDFLFLKYFNKDLNDKNVLLDYNKYSYNYYYSKTSFDNTTPSKFSSLILSDEYDENYIYINDIYKEKLLNEKQYLLKNPIFGYNQTFLSLPQYKKLFYFFIEVCLDQNIHFSTLFHTLSLLKIILNSKFMISRSNFLLIGCSCLLISSKYLEINLLNIDTLLKYVKYSFTRIELYNTEKLILNLLNYNISIPNRYEFCLIYLNFLNFSEIQKNLLYYIVIISYLDYNLNYFNESNIAAACIHYVLQMTSHHYLYYNKQSHCTQYNSSPSSNSSNFQTNKIFCLSYIPTNIVDNYQSFFNSLSSSSSLSSTSSTDISSPISASINLLTSASSFSSPSSTIIENDQAIWSNYMINLTGYCEDNLLDPILRLRKLHWSINDLPLYNFTDYFKHKKRCGVSDLLPLSYNSLKFHNISIKLPSSENHIKLTEFATYEL